MPKIQLKLNLNKTFQKYNNKAQKKNNLTQHLHYNKIHLITLKSVNNFPNHKLNKMK